MKECNLIVDTMTKRELKNMYKYSIYPKDSRNFTDKRFVEIDNGCIGLTQWTCFYMKDNKP